MRRGHETSSWTYKLTSGQAQPSAVDNAAFFVWIVELESDMHMTTYLESTSLQGIASGVLEFCAFPRMMF